jgi:hypothetical protein
MNWFKIDYYKLVKQLLPVMLRQPVIVALLETMVSPIDALYGLFRTNRDAGLYRLGITPQVCYLEKALNDRFDYSDRHIYITDGVYYDSLYLFTDGENLDEYIYTDGENDALYLYTRGETGAESADFIVNVPVGLVFNVPEMKAVIDMYKLVGKSYVVSSK